MNDFMGNCVLCVYSLSSANQGRIVHKLDIPKATHHVKIRNGIRDVCFKHYTVYFNIMTNGISNPENTIVFLARKDKLYDMVMHPRGLMKFGLSKRERDAYADAQPKYNVQEIEEKDET